MLFKDISSFSSGGHFVQWSRTVSAILVEGILRNMNLDQWLWKFRFKNISIFSSGGHFVQQSKTVRGYNEEHFCEIILNLGQWLRNSIFSSGSHFVWYSRTICAISIEGIMGNNNLKLLHILTSGSEDVV